MTTSVCWVDEMSCLYSVSSLMLYKCAHLCKSHDCASYIECINTRISLKSEKFSFNLFHSFCSFIWTFLFVIWLTVSLVVARSFFLVVARSTHSIMFKLIWLMSIIVLRTVNDLIFALEWTELFDSWIHFTSVISLRS
jgi:hypothetical protein